MNGMSQLLGIITTHFLFPVCSVSYHCELNIFGLWRLVKVSGVPPRLQNLYKKTGWIEKVLFAQFSLSFPGEPLNVWYV